MATKQKRLVLHPEDMEVIQRIATVTRCDSPSIALRMLISRYGETFISDWKVGGASNTALVTTPPTPPPNLTEPLDF